MRFASRTFCTTVVPSLLIATAVSAQRTPPADETVVPSPYEVVTGWHKPFSEPGFAFNGNAGVFAESPDRIFVAMRGEILLPDPLPEGYLGYAGSIGLNVLTARDRRVWRNCIYTLNGEGVAQEIWTQWDHLCAASEGGDGPHRLRISPYDPERRVWVINESTHQIYVFSNDGSDLVMTLGELNVPGEDPYHFARPQDVAFLPDGRFLVADGLDNHRILVYDRDGGFLAELGSHGEGPGQFYGVHAVATGPGGRIFALDRSGGRINVWRTTGDPRRYDFVATWDGFQLPLDIIVNEESLWITDLRPLRFVKLDFEGNKLYTWLVPPDHPDGYLEVHTFSVDVEGNLYGGDNQYGRTQKLVPKAGADPELLIGPPWYER